MQRAYFHCFLLCLPVRHAVFAIMIIIIIIISDLISVYFKCILSVKFVMSNIATVVCCYGRI